MNTNDLISVVVTVRDGAAYLRDAIDSLLAQTDPQFEIVVVDDGSADGTPEILRSYTDPRLVTRSIGAAGRAIALAKAVGIARGNLIAVLDADDVALPHRLATQRRFLEEHRDVALVGSAAIEFDGLRDWRRPSISGRENVRRALGMLNPFYHSSVMFRRDAYNDAGGYLPDGGWGHDKDFLIRMACRYPVDIIDEPLIRYRRHRDQWSSRIDGESFRRRKSASIQLRAARQLGLPGIYWIYPLMGWVYAHLPASLRPRAIKAPVQRVLLRVLGVLRHAPSRREE